MAINKKKKELAVHYTSNGNAWQTKDTFQECFTNCFLHEIGEIRDEHVPIQFLIDNCSAHNAEILTIQDPDVTIEFLPPNTTSLCQPMDQAVLNSVKVFQKREYYLNMFQYCEMHNFEAKAFNEFLKEYTVLDAILDISKGWTQVSTSTIQKSFRKVFPQEKWVEVTGRNY